MAFRRHLWVGALSIAFIMGGAGGTRAEDRGEVYYDVCQQCHGTDGGGNQLFLAPAIAGMQEWYVAAQLRKFRRRIRGAHFDDVAGLRMGPMARTLPDDEAVDQVAAYVAALPSTQPKPVLHGGDPAKGQQLYTLCATCHGTKGEGLQALNGPRLTHTNDWYLADQMYKFQTGIRGGNPNDVTGILMRPMSLGLDDQGVKDVIAYILTLSE